MDFSFKTLCKSWPVTKKKTSFFRRIPGKSQTSCVPMATYSNTSFLLLRGPHVRVPTPPSKFATLFPFTAHLAGAVFWHPVVVTHGEFFTGGPTGVGGVEAHSRGLSAEARRLTNSVLRCPSLRGLCFKAVESAREQQIQERCILGKPPGSNMVAHSFQGSC